MRTVILSVVLVGGALSQVGCAHFFQLNMDQSRFEHALALHRSQRADEALAVYWSLDPANRRYPGVLNNIAVIHAQLGDLDQAEKMLDLAAEMEQDEVVIWANLGVVRYHQHRHLLACQALERVAPIGERQLVRSVTPGRVKWLYKKAHQKVKRSIAVADRYLALIAGADQHVKPTEQGRLAMIRSLDVLF